MSYEDASEKIYELSKLDRSEEGKRLPKEQWLEMLNYASRVKPLTSSLTREQMLKKVWLKLDSLGLYDRNSIPDDHDVTLIYNASKIGYILAIYSDMHPVDLLIFGHFCRNLKDLENAKKYYILAAEKDNLNALIGLGAIANEEGDLDLSLKYLQQALDSGLIRSYCNIGNIYQKKGDMTKAMEMWTTGADHGDLDCAHTIAVVTNSYDPETSEKYLNKGIEGNHEFSLLLKGSLLLSNDDDEGWIYLERAAELGNSIAMYHLVHRYSWMNELDKVELWTKRLIGKKDYMTKRWCIQMVGDDDEDIEDFIKTLPDTKIGLIDV